MLSMLCVRLTIKVKVGIPESFKVGWYHPKNAGSSHLNFVSFFMPFLFTLDANNKAKNLWTFLDFSHSVGMFLEF